MQKSKSVGEEILTTLVLKGSTKRGDVNMEILILLYMFGSISLGVLGTAVGNKLQNRRDRIKRQQEYLRTVNKQKITKLTENNKFVGFGFEISIE